MIELPKFSELRAAIARIKWYLRVGKTKYFKFISLPLTVMKEPVSVLAVCQMMTSLRITCQLNCRDQSTPPSRKIYKIQTIKLNDLRLQNRYLWLAIRLFWSELAIRKDDSFRPSADCGIYTHVPKRCGLRLSTLFAKCWTAPSRLAHDSARSLTM
jgi:hypothetical protein